MLQCTIAGGRTKRANNLLFSFTDMTAMTLLEDQQCIVHVFMINTHSLSVSELEIYLLPDCLTAQLG